ncbi:universal stress protein [Nonomuraea sp. NPDC050691]|uniref:universal stress protein n=1 Tax=Nonomuraea sp. NPDC050691 TaxID=3155661 RepID=UPI0033D7BC54
MTNPVVVGIDGSHGAYAALGWAVQDAVRRGLPLRIVHVREPWKSEHPVGAGGGGRSLTERSERLLAGAEERVRQRAPRLEVTTAHLVGAVVERLRTESETADTVVVGSRGLGGFAGLVLGSVGLALAGHAHGPVVVVRAPELPAAGGGEVVAGFDGSADAEAALEYAMEQAAARGARLRVVYARHTVVLAPQAVGYGPLPAGALADEAAEVGRRLPLWRDKYPEVEVVESAVSGHPVPVLAAASRTAVLLAIGSRGLGGFAASVLGSTCHGVIHRAHCPVAVVRAPWRRS